jgi:hypothetical protein
MRHVPLIWAIAHLALVVLLVKCGVVLLLLQLLKLRLLHMQLETCVREQLGHPASGPKQIFITSAFCRNIQLSSKPATSGHPLPSMEQQHVLINIAPAAWPRDRHGALGGRRQLLVIVILVAVAAHGVLCVIRALIAAIECCRLRALAG